MERFMDDDMLVEHGKDTTQMWVKYEDCVQEIALTKADAQATIAALQDERDGWVRSREHYYQLWMRATDERDEMRKERDEFESLFAQRTAELEAARKWKLELCNLTPGGSEFADDPAYCAQWVRKSRENQHNVILDKYREAKALKAELERVRGERDEAISKVDKWRDKWLERGAELVKPCEQCGHSSFDPTQRVVQSQHRQGMEG